MEAARRLALGQWYTPEAVADLAIGLARPLPGVSGQVLDPACGDGVFLARAVALGLDPARLAGVEIDPDAARQALARVPGARVVRGDLFDLDAPEGADGFAAVVGNPPYVRQERVPPERKRRIRLRLAADYPDAPADLLDRLVGRGDLAAACIARCLRLARPGARVALVVSSALLDAGYARSLWRLVAHAGRVVALVDAPRERWFPDAAVNAVILVLERAPPGGRQDPERGVELARLTVTTREAARRIGRMADLAAVAELRAAPADRPERWAPLLRAAPAWFELERAAAGRMTPLGELVAVRRGLTSGANDVFYLDRARAAALGLEPEVLLPLCRSPRERGGEEIAIDPDRASTLVLAAPADPAELARFPAARRYLEERASAAERPTLRAREPWWALPLSPARLFLTKAYAARFVQRLSTRPIACDQRLYSLHPRAGGPDPELLAGVLNSTFTAFALESLGRASLGEGALEWTVADARGLPVLDPRALGDEEAAAVRRSLAELARRPIGDAAAERARQDRAALDRAVAAGVPELERSLPDVHAALVSATSARAARARAG